MDDYTDVSKALWESLKEIAGDSPLIFMGHGTEHSADESYMIIEQALRAYARHPVYIATVEGKRTIQDVIRQMKDEGIVNTRVVLAPFMLVAGDHANNDMAGERFICKYIKRRRICAGMCPERNWRISGSKTGVSVTFAESRNTA